MKGGIIVRLIDVVFILLFGFITASDIIQKTQIGLPPLATVGKPPEGESPLVIRISIRPTKYIDDAVLEKMLQQLQAKGKKAGDQAERSKKTQKKISEEFIKYIVKAGTGMDAKEDSVFTVDKLENYILWTKNTKCKKENRKLIIAIIPHPQSMVQGTVNVFDICERYRIEYTFRYYGESNQS